MDFYWHYSGKDTIDSAGKESFLRAISVAAQVFAAITEYIQVNTLSLDKDNKNGFIIVRQCITLTS